MDYSGLWAETVRRQAHHSAWQVVRRKWSEPRCSDGRVDRISGRTKCSVWEKERIHECLWGLQPETQLMERAELQLLELGKTGRVWGGDHGCGPSWGSHISSGDSKQAGGHVSWRSGRRSWSHYCKFGYQFQAIWLGNIRSRDQPMASHSVTVS